MKLLGGLAYTLSHTNLRQRLSWFSFSFSPSPRDQYFLNLIIFRCFISLLLFLSFYRKRFRLLNARPEIESLNSVGNLIKRRFSLVYLGVCVCFFSTHLYPTTSPIYKRLWINRGGWILSDVLQKLLCLATKFNEKYV